MALIVGLNPFGMAYTFGFWGVGTDRANTTAQGIERFVELAGEIGARSIELPNVWLSQMSRESVTDLNGRLAEREIVPIVACGPPVTSLDSAIPNAAAVGAPTIRVGMSSVLCGDRAEVRSGWQSLVAEAKAALPAKARHAADLGIVLALENHQDFGSRELVELSKSAGDNVGVTLDTANPLAVGEDCLSFARTVAPRVRHMHLKDYRVQLTSEGFRLIRCAVGEGVVPFAEVEAILAAHQDTLTASIEVGALDVRHIRLFTRHWWEGYEPRSAQDLADCLRRVCGARLPDSEEWRTPWELGASGQDVIDYEYAQLVRSARNVRAMGWM